MIPNIGLTQALSLWSDLEAAYYNESKYGGNVAELYIYRFQPHAPLAERGRGQPRSSLAGKAWHDVTSQANRDLYALLDHFTKVHEDAIVEVEHPEGFKAIGPWLAEAMYDHRVHVRVTRKERG
jgi:hypothetical protein